MSKKTLGIILIVVGALIAVAGVTMGLVGIPTLGFGYKKIAMIVFGVVVAVIGVGVSMAKGSTPVDK
jgi:hypothetical protein